MIRALEMMRGLSLEQLLAERGRLGLDAVVRLVAQIAMALDHAHDLGRVHRDAKPSNILLTTDLRTAKLSDFGVARIERSHAATTTQVGEIVGTPRCLSPEQVAGSTIDGRSDLFCLGVVAYEMVTGAKAFDAGSLPALLAMIAHKDPVAIRKLRPDLPPGAALMIGRMMA